MKRTLKAFDCVGMKSEAQKALLDEFKQKAREGESLDEFLCARARQSKWVSEIWRRFGGTMPAGRWPL